MSTRQLKTGRFSLPTFSFPNISTSTSTSTTSSTTLVGVVSLHLNTKQDTKLQVWLPKWTLKHQKPELSHRVSELTFSSQPQHINTFPFAKSVTFPYCFAFPTVEDELMMSLNPPHLRDRGPSEPPPNTNMVGSSLSRGSLPPESNAKTSYKMPDYSDPNVFEAYYKVLTSGAPNPIKGEPGNTNDGSDCAPSNACISAGQAAPNANTPAARASRTYKLRKSLPPKRKGQEWNNVKKDIEKEEKKLGKYRVAIAKKVIWDHGGAAWRKIMVKQEGLNANAPYQNPQKDTRGGGAKLRTLAPTASEDEKKVYQTQIMLSFRDMITNFLC